DDGGATEPTENTENTRTTGTPGTTGTAAATGDTVEAGGPAAAPVGPLPTGRPRLGELLVERGEVSTADVSWALQRQLDGDDRQIGVILLEEGKAAPSALTEALQSQSKRS